MSQMDEELFHLSTVNATPYSLWQRSQPIETIVMLELILNVFNNRNYKLMLYATHIDTTLR